MREPLVLRLLGAELHELALDQVRDDLRREATRVRGAKLTLREAAKPVLAFARISSRSLASRYSPRLFAFNRARERGSAHFTRRSLRCLSLYIHRRAFLTPRLYYCDLCMSISMCTQETTAHGAQCAGKKCREKYKNEIPASI